MSHVALKVTQLQWLCPQTFEVRFERPAGFGFVSGQKIDIAFQDTVRTYTLVSSPDVDELAICVRHVPQGRFTPILARAKVGDNFKVTPAYGYFTYQPSRLPAVFVATGTGVAPFVSFARSGADGFHLLHGVRTPEQLYYHDILASASGEYTPCLSEKNTTGSSSPNRFQGRVTTYLKNALPRGAYDFYLCGRNEMIADAMGIIDDRFAGSKVFSEMFF